MKKILFSILFISSALCSQAQNVQLHYDFGRNIYPTDEENRQFMTLTYEQFKADNIGSWYYFVDLDINNKQGVEAAYTEISREFNVAKSGEKNSFACHVEFDGGVSRGAHSYQSAVLVGPAWNGHNSDFSTTYSIQVLYKHFLGQSASKGANDNITDNYASFQVTGVWGTTFAQGKLTFSGFADLWLGKNRDDSGKQKNCLVFLTEPQLWYNISKTVSVGTEVEVSSNFIYRNTDFNNKGFYVNPTLAVKFNL